MASDLIPPSSPAGRPEPDGGAPRLIELPPEPPRAGAEPAQKPTKPGPSQFRNRFGFLMGALAGVFVAAALVATAVIVSSGGSSAEDAGLAKNWSKWHPTDSSVSGGATEIATKVGAEYRHADGRQLVKVTGGELGISVALRAATGRITTFDGTGVLYQLDGLGPNGSIKGGKPSPQRLQLIRREALELALYTFRYLPDVEMVVTLLPPPPPEDGTPAASPTGGLLASTGAKPEEMNAIFYRPGDLKDRLTIPLGMTVGAKAPAPEDMGGAEGKLVDSLTQSNLFRWSITRTQDSTLQLVLDRPS